MKVSTFGLLFGIAIIKKINKIGDSEVYMERRQAQIQTFRQGLISMAEKRISFVLLWSFFFRTCSWLCSMINKINKIKNYQKKQNQKHIKRSINLNMFFLCITVIKWKVFTSWHLLAESWQWKHQNNVRNPLKVNNKDTRATSMRSI